MNTSAKFTLSLLAAAALGAVAVACTVTSGTVNDFDGGTNNSSGGTSGTSGTVVDGGADASETFTCPQLTYEFDIDSNACQQCLNQFCCAETAACWNIADTADKLGCSGYVDQLNACDQEAEDSGQDPNECKRVTKESATAEGVPAAYDTYHACRTTNCDSVCNTITEGTAPDGGTQ